MDFISEINENNYQDFIKKHGKITDVELAKELLCQTTNAWLILDDNLKLDPEIIMYYQPMINISIEGYVDVGAMDQIFWVHPIQKGFKKCGIFGECIPDINFPEGFDFEKYIEIQRRLSKNSIYESCNEKYKFCASYHKHNNLGFPLLHIEIDPEKFFNKTGVSLKNISFNSESVQISFYNQPDEELVSYTVYDKSKLNDIVNSVLNKSENKKR